MKKIFVNRSWLEARIAEIQQELKQKTISQEQQNRLKYLTEKIKQLKEQTHHFIEISNE